MRVIAVIDHRVVVEKILRHLGQWNGTTPLPPPARLRTVRMGRGLASRATTWIRCPTTRTSSRIKSLTAAPEKRRRQISEEVRPGAATGGRFLGWKHGGGGSSGGVNGSPVRRG